ncbi:uncharacterized protein LOC126799780 [Argentina anserina]|uniref:uncharacterized protein LOC126799780 n=1 Tax=Argentina anserina TaxID=57926 RepID=UPI0021769192|nr:uncharacterized protein LOC126799780 [Potentilla anserina]
MEGNKPTDSSSTFTSEPFGSKDSSTSSSGIFGAIFAPPMNSPKVLSRESLRSELTKKKVIDQPMNFNSAQSGDYSNGKGEGQSKQNKDMSSYYHDQRVQQPCHLSSSIYYGGQDIYHHPQNSQDSGSNSSYKKDWTDDDGTACRGNWWQGSLYY